MVANMKKIIIGIVLIAVAVLAYLTFFQKEDSKEGIVDEVNGYVLESNKSEYYNELFSSLKEMYEKEYTDEEHASLIAQLFLTDNLSLNTALSKNDVGGVQFVYESYRTDFIHIARDTIYKFVENNVYGNRKQELPSVKEVIVETVTDEEFELLDDTVDVISVKAKIVYEKDLGYQEEAELLLYKTNDKFEVIKMD